ncbi:natural killer cell receptor 2B4 isoform X2 [Alligator mississippiensis]|uniref:natural killer cell receptor 2B4 isoform X2 n=1 Tax=Alligator mississippiensis TaxID=8496 RepID=UPI0009071402|nr:natural killer cell receptor 2B4 isoform X2 [Alligator mississippiensis]
MSFSPLQLHTCLALHCMASAQLRRRRNVRRKHTVAVLGVCAVRTMLLSQPLHAPTITIAGQEHRPLLRRGCTSWLVTTSPCSLTPRRMLTLLMRAVMEEALCLFLLCLLLHFQAQALGCKEMEVAVVTEESVWLVPENQPSVWDEITWRMRLSSGVQYWIVELANRDSRVELNTASPLGRRVTFHPKNFSLQIELVNKSDSGNYFMDMTSPFGTTHTTCFRVSVFDRVRQPKLTALSAHAELRRCNVTLSCQVQDTDRVAYSWSRGASWSPATGDQQLPGHQSQLQLEITEGSKDTFYHCNASNAASWGMATIHVKTVCRFPATG